MDFIYLFFFALGKSCSNGYVKKIGNLGCKGNLEGCRKHQVKRGFTTDIYDCRQQCDSNPKCLSYTYSFTWQKCVLQNVADPIDNNPHDDYTWCAKGINSIRIVSPIK